jgi:hypothetical protein
MAREVFFTLEPRWRQCGLGKRPSSGGAAAGSGSGGGLPAKARGPSDLSDDLPRGLDREQPVHHGGRNSASPRRVVSRRRDTRPSHADPALGVRVLPWGAPRNAHRGAGGGVRKSCAVCGRGLIPHYFVVVRCPGGLCLQSRVPSTRGATCHSPSALRAWRSGGRVLLPVLPFDHRGPHAVEIGEGLVQVESREECGHADDD